MKIACSGCGIELNYASSAVCQDLKRHTVVSLSLRVAALISGIGFAGYDKLFKRHLGMHTITDKQFYATIEMCSPHVKDMLDEICEIGKDEMKAIADTELGCWKRAVTTSDGAWHIRGFFSQNSTFVIRHSSFAIFSPVLSCGMVMLPCVVVTLSLKISMKVQPNQQKDFWQLSCSIEHVKSYLLRVSMQSLAHIPTVFRQSSNLRPRRSNITIQVAL